MLLYIHFPFCRSKCAYCDFISYAGCSDALVFSYLTALKREIEFAGRRFENAAVDTVYLGGGTPSLLSPRQIDGLFGKIRKSFAHYSPSEVSAEVNPESATDDVLAAFADAGVNRISMGVQSFSDDNLRSVGRIHTADAARRAAERIARRANGAGADATASLVKAYPLTLCGTLDASSAQVMSGGLSTAEFDDGLESLKVRGAYAIGEVLDIDGICGGYNLQWAWSSAAAVLRKFSAN